MTIQGPRAFFHPVHLGRCTGLDRASDDLMATSGAASRLGGVTLVRERQHVTTMEELDVCLVTVRPNAHACSTADRIPGRHDGRR